MKPVPHIHLILLAAGCSRRFGSNKLLFRLDEKPLWRHMLDKLSGAARASGMGKNIHIYVVTQYREILVQTRQLSRSLPPGSPPLSAVYSPDSPGGISYTIRAGLDAAQKSAEQVIPLPLSSGGSSCGRNLYFFFAADQPYLKEQSILDFLLAAIDSGKSLGCVCHENIPGNPAFFDETFLPELYSLTGDHGGRKVLHSHWENCFLYPLSDPKELQDVDNPDVFEKVCGKACVRAPKSVE